MPTTGDLTAPCLFEIPAVQPKFGCLKVPDAGDPGWITGESGWTSGANEPGNRL